MLGRLFAAREIALGVATASADPAIRRQALIVGVAVDTADTVASVIDVARGRNGVRAALLVGCGAALFAGLGTASLLVDDTSPV